MKTMFWKIFNLVAGCAFIIGVLFLFFTDKQVGFETSDGIHGVYEVFKVIQSKRPYLQQIDHNFKWTGSKTPDISSELQDIKTP